MRTDHIPVILWDEWEKVTEKLKESGCDLSKIRIVQKRKDENNDTE